MTENDRLALLADIFGTGDRDVTLGIGDDAAALTCAGQLVVSVDSMVAGVHFDRAWLSLDDLGYRATMAALSDLAAMAARPRGVLGSLILPSTFSDEELRSLAEGQAGACREAGVTMLGGNLARGRELSITTTVLGECDSPVTRAGARPGDAIYLVGAVGLAGAGLVALRDGHDDAELAPAIEAWRRPRAQLDAIADIAQASAAIDISDGLALDATRLAAASGVALVFDVSPANATLTAAAAILGREAEALAWTGGEDYAVLLTAAASLPHPRLGRVEAGRGVFREREGERIAVAADGWDHFAEG